MKTKLSSLFAALVLGAAVPALAGQAPGSWQRIRTAEEFGQLKPDDKVLYVCTQCETVTEKIIASPAEAMDHCREGASLTCPACKTQVKVTYAPGGQKVPSIKREIVYTNAKGEPCFFVAKAVTKK